MVDTNEQFRKVVDELAGIQGWSVAAIIRLAAKHGLATNWTRERYYQRTAVQAGDCDKLELIRVHVLSADELDDNNPESSARYYQEKIQELSWSVELSRAAVARMCHECADPDPGEQGYCWTGGCPLRRVSPLPLMPKEKRRP